MLVKWNWRKSRIIFPRENEYLVGFDFLYWRIAKTTCDCIESLSVFCYNIGLFSSSLQGIIALQTNDNCNQSRSE